MTSINRRVEPAITFARGGGAHLYDVGGNRYTDYYAAFGPYLLRHNAPRVEDAVRRAMRDGWTLTGTGADTVRNKQSEGKR